MKIQDKLIADKKSIVKDIDEAIAKMDEYVSIIDVLAEKVESAKEAFEKIKIVSTESHISGEMIYTNDALDAFWNMALIAKDALQKLNGK